MKVSTGYKLLALASVILIAYGSAWLKAYSLSENYFAVAVAASRYYPPDRIKQKIVPTATVKATACPTDADAQ